MANRQEFERHLRPEDLLLVPPFPADMGILDWHRHTELMEATYLWALHELARPQDNIVVTPARERRTRAMRSVGAATAHRSWQGDRPGLLAASAGTPGLRHRDPIAAGNRH
jgi:hypothetical protein